MFFRQKKAGGHVYLQIVENRWEQGGTHQRVLATLGRLDRLQGSGHLEALLESGSRFSQTLTVLSEHGRGELPAVRTSRIGAPLIFERLWQQTGCAEVLATVLGEREFQFPVERAIFLEVLHRLVDPGSDRACYGWKDAYRVAGVGDLDLHHAYRAMAWLGEPEAEGSERTTKDRIEEALFARRRDLFSSLDLVFFDTTSIYFEGAGGQSVGQYGHSKDHRPDLRQMVVGLVLDQEGRPICCELWPGNTTDVTTLLPVVERLEKRFGIRRVCILADRGMISAKTIEALEKRGWPYILGARMRSHKEVREQVLGHPGRYRVVHSRRAKATDPSPLKVKEVCVDGRRYLVCLNEEQAKKDAADRQAILVALEGRLGKGSKGLVGNRGFRRYLEVAGEGFRIDEDKVQADARYDGKWVLRTNTDYEPAEVALAYKQLWMVEDLFRSMKSLLATRPIFHRRDETIRGHVFCSFLALLLRTELEDRLAARGHGEMEWAHLIRDLDRLEQIELDKDGKRFVLRTEAAGASGKVFQAVGVALPPTVQQVE
jgi:Transposase DDE domain